MKKFYGILVLLLILSIAIYLSRSDFLDIKSSSIKILGADCLNQNDVRAVVLAQSPKIYLFKDENFINTLQKKFICIDSVKLNKKYPSSLDISITGKKAVVVLDNLVTNYNGKIPDLSVSDLEATPSSQSAFLSLGIDDILSSATESAKFQVDRFGQIFSDQPPAQSTFEIIYLGDRLEMGQRVNTTLLSNALRALTKIKALSLSVKGKPMIYNGDLEIKSNNPDTLILALDKDISQELASLQLILQTVKINSDSKTMQSVDLRFNKPVVVFSSR